MCSLFAKPITALMLVFLSAPSVFACEGEIPTHRGDFRNAHAIFIGRAIEIISNPTTPEGYATGEIDYAVRFAVEKSWKGPKTWYRKLFLLEAGQLNGKMKRPGKKCGN